MLRIRLSRTGAKKRPSYRVVVAESRFPRDGRHVEILGFYDPMMNPSTIQIDVDRAVRWLRNGAQPTERARILLRHAGVLKAHDEARMADRRGRGSEQDGDLVEDPQKAAGAPASTSDAVAPEKDEKADDTTASAGTKRRSRKGE